MIADRVNITYGERRELPFVVGVLADFGGQAEKPPLGSRRFIDVNRENYKLLFRTGSSLEYLVNSAGYGNTRIRILDVSKKELYRDLLKATDFEQSILFKKLHDDIFGVTGAEPFGIVIVDFDISNESRDLDLLERMSQVGAAIHAPFLATAAPELLGVQDFNTPRYAKWRLFRQTEAARYVCLTADAFALGVRIISAADQFGWFAQIGELEASDLKYLLSISRFVHYLRVIIRDQQGANVPHATRQQMLNDWMGQYVSVDGEQSAAQPLRSAYVHFPQRSKDSGVTTVSVYASPGFQLETLSNNLRATFLLPPF